MAGRKVLIIGGDACGMSAASRAKRRDPDLDIEAFEMTGVTSYGACGMPYYVGGQVKELNQLVIRTPQQFWDNQGLRVHAFHQVTRINPEKRTVEVKDLSAGRIREETYDQLVLATGAEPIVPPGLDTSLEGVFTLRGLPEAGKIKEYIQERGVKEALIVGAGYIGLEMAEAFAALGVRVRLVELTGRAAPVFEPEISAVVEKELRKKGVDVLSGVVTGLGKAVDGGLVARLGSGEEVGAGLVLVAVGVRPRSELAAQAGLRLGVRKAVWVDRKQRTSDSLIFSGGDCAEAWHRVLQANAYVPLALTANRQGRIIGDNLCGAETDFPGILGTAVFKCFDLTVARTGLGLAEAKEAGFDAVKVLARANSRPHYYPGGGPIEMVLVVDRASRKPLGAQMAGIDGVAKRIDILATAISADLTLARIEELDLAYAPPFSTTWDPVLIAAQVALKQLGQEA